MATAAKKVIKYKEIRKYIHDNLGSYQGIGKHLAEEFDKYVIGYDGDTSASRAEEALMADPPGEGGEEGDEEALPELPQPTIYAVKWRIKSARSAYLKTKRKPNYASEKSIKDYLGIRVLCLFERDLVSANAALLRYFAVRRHTLEELKIYNFEKDAVDKINGAFAKERGHVLKAIARDKDKEPGGGPGRGPAKEWVEKPLSDRKGSGYKSVHYILETLENLHYEVQLRTLIQDVWGELEHSLSYKKGAINPHIKKSFELLSKDLSNVDELMEHLKDISVKEEILQATTSLNEKTKHYFDYDGGDIPKEIEKDREEQYRKYTDAIARLKEATSDGRAEALLNAWECYNPIADAFSERAVERNPRLEYWLKMEKAYLHLCESRLDKAQDIYELLRKKDAFGKKYCLMFRLGEIATRKGKMEEALSWFDRCEGILDGPKNKDSHIKNRFDIKLALALVYFMLGDEYIDITLKKVLAAKEIYEKEAKPEDIRNRVNDSRLYNNMVWYRLTRYIIPKGADKKELNDKKAEFLKDLEDSFGQFDVLLKADAELERKLEERLLKLPGYKAELAKLKADLGKRKPGKALARQLEELEAAITELEAPEVTKENLLSSSALDTAAWYYYHMYQKYPNRVSYKRKALEYSEKVSTRKGYTTLNSASYHMQQNHRKEILDLK